MDLRDTTAVVTGAASGIGRALARSIHGRGARLVLADRDVAPLRAVAAELDGHPVTMDVSRAGDYQGLMAAVDAPRLLCLNAGVVSTSPGPVWEAPPDEWRRVLDINVGGVINGLRAFVPRMLASGEDHSILITASLAGLATWPGGGPYAASKHAVVAIAEQAALALADDPITVSVLCPALVRTGMSDVGDDPADIAEAALNAVEQRRFVVLPDEWAEAVHGRARRLTSGLMPELPAPSS